MLHFRFTFLSPSLQGEASPWDALLTQYVLQGHESDGDTVVEHVLDLPVNTLQEQVSLWSAVSNFHWWCSVKVSGAFISEKNQPKYSQHLLVIHDQRKLLPASPRHVLMHCLPFLTQSELPQSLLNVPDRQADAEMRFMRNLLHLVRYDQEDVDTIVSSSVSLPPQPNPTPTHETLPEEPQPKKRKYTARVLTGIPDDLLEDAILSSHSGEEAVKSAVPDRSQYDLFCEKLHLDDGLVQWRLHSNEEEVVIMNDYSPTTGQWKSLDHVHVTASYTDPAEVQIKCTCKSYEYMQGLAIQRNNLDIEEDTVLSAEFTCMHCRFFAQFLQSIHGSFLSQDPISPMHKKVLPTIKETNCAVLLLGVASPSITTKLSVVGRDGTTPAFVHIYFTPTGCYAKCQDGMCSALHNIKKKIPRGICLKDLEQGQMCDHIFTLYHNQDYVMASR